MYKKWYQKEICSCFLDLFLILFNIWSIILSLGMENKQINLLKCYEVSCASSKMKCKIAILYERNDVVMKSNQKIDV